MSVAAGFACVKVFHSYPNAFFSVVMISKIDPLGRPPVSTGSDNCFLKNIVCTSFKLLKIFSKQNKVHLKLVIGTVDMAEGIIDGTHVFSIVMISKILFPCSCSLCFPPSSSPAINVKEGCFIAVLLVSVMPSLSHVLLLRSLS